MEIHLTDDVEADRLLSDDPFALLTGMLLDQQIAMEVAFVGPHKIVERIGSIDPAVVAEYDPDAFKAAFSEKPAVHRFPGSMSGRVQSLAAAIVDDWDGDTAAIWTRDSPSGAEVLKRLKKLPGFGEQKAKIFLALLGKQLGFDGEGWREASAPYGEEGAKRSVADIHDRASLLEVRETKRAAKAAKEK
ncbi:HhH-GPD-type base excision DNA repair protein [uncultured Agrococcus sp.]|uniref:HhH-GPD-type base excision DNA repair protein n=1 Tax=uncultured Agrococcus sp. TaxID=382258 RepID=UPI0025DD886C|nr:HhH-GPD-type base excision DNA repair protein [uncultured Agrococcus sp.]